MFEGIDGAGKSSRLDALAERLGAKGCEVVRLVEPTHGAIGGEIRRRAQHGPPMSPAEELDLFMQDRRENVTNNVEPALARGSVVLQDRYFYSTAAYQAARPALGLTPEEVVRLHDWAPLPDLVVVLDLSVEAGLARVSGRGAADAFEHADLQQRVRDNFHTLSETTPCFRLVNADAAPAEVDAAIWALVEPLLQPEFTS